MADDGHAIKLARAAGICQEVTKKYQDRDWVLIKGNDTWDKINHLIIDSLQSPGVYWVRSAGLDEAWTVSLPKVATTLSHSWEQRLLTCEKLGDSEYSQAVTLRARPAAGHALDFLHREHTPKFLKLGKSLCSKTLSTVAACGPVSLDWLGGAGALSRIVYYLCTSTLSQAQIGL